MVVLVLVNCRFNGVIILKKILVIIGLMLGAWAAHAGPIEELTKAFQAEQAKNADKATPAGTGQTVLRAYLATQSGFMAITTGNTYFGYLVPKSLVPDAVASLGFVPLPSQGTLDIYAASAGSQYVGYTLMVFNDAFGYANEIYLMNTKLP